MADARSLLRAQRAARRINHPHALYSDSGKLNCAVCHELIKSDAQWDAHVRGAAHRQRLLVQQKARAAREAPEPLDDPSTNGASGGATAKSRPDSTDTPTDEALLAQIISGGGAGHKRKHSSDEDDDVDMADAAAEDGAPQSKRTRHDKHITATATAAAAAAAANGSPMKTDAPDKNSRTPPGLTRRISGTPSHGVEIQIPSRPATPSASATSATSTPKATPMGRSPLIPQDAQMGAVSGSSNPAPKAAFVTPAATGRAHSSAAALAATTAAAAASNDDDDWAAFEAEVVHAAPAAPPTTTANASAAFSNEAVISAAPLTAEQLAAKSREEEREKRRMQADVDLEDEKEEATRALEAEFEEMEELEARVRKLKEKREAIRRGSTAGATGAVPAEEDSVPEPQPDSVNGTAIEEEDENEEDDDEDDEDDWAGFRFRA